MDTNEWKTKIKYFWVKYEYKFILIIGFILVAVISFEAGLMKGREVPPDSIIIEKSVESRIAGEETKSSVLTASTAVQEAGNASGETSQPKKDCTYVGSKNSDKYHLPICSYAKRIKPENIICFKDENEAKLKGYQPDSNCIK